MQLQGSQWVIALAAASFLAWPGAVRGQEPAETAPPTGQTPADPPPAEQRIYLPYRNLRTVFEKHGAAVFLPFQDYLKLWEQTLGKGLRPADQPPVGGAITSANYEAVVAQDQVRIQAVYQVQVLQSGWVEIPLKFGNAAIGSVSAEPGPVLLRGTGEGEYALLFSKSGEHTVRLELTGRVLTAPEGRSFDLQIPTVGITNFQLTVPEADQSIELQPKLLLQGVPGEPKTTSIKASVGSTGKVTARWRPRVGTKPDMELLASATSATAVTVEDGLLHADAYFTVDVLRGQLERLRVAVPLGHRILDVASSAGVKEWTVAAEEGRQVVTVELLSRQGGKIPLEVHTELPVSGEPFDVAGLEGETAHGVHLLDVLRESGQVALRAGADLSLNIITQQGLARIDEAEVDPRIKKPGASFFRFFSPQCRLTATVRPIEPRLLVNHLALVTIETDRIKLDSALTYTIERAGVFELRFGVPEGLTIENVTCESFKQFDVSADGQTLTVSLREGKLGTLAVRVQGIRKRAGDAASEEFVAPLLEPQGVEVETGRLQIIASESLEILTDSAQVVGFQPDRAAEVSIPAPLRLVSAWTFSRRPVNLSGRIVAKPTRLTAHVASQLEIKQGQVQADVGLHYLVEYAGLDVFRFAVPEAVADRVQITLADGQTAPIREKSRGDVQDGWVTWTVVLQREVVGPVRLKVTYDLQPTVAENATAETATVALPRVVDPFDAAENDPRRRSISVARVTGEVTARKDRALSVTATASGGDVETIDVRELTRLPQDGFVAFRYFKQPVEVQLASSKFEIQPVLETVVSRGLVEVVLDRTGLADFRCRYQVKTSERQRLRIDLPFNVEPLGVFLDRKSIALEKNPDARAADGWDSYFVNVARTKSSDEPFLLSVQYRLKYKAEKIPFATRSGKLDLFFPIVAGTRTTAAPIQQFRVQVWTPDEFALVGTPTNFETEHRPRVIDLLRTGRPVAIGDDYQRWIGDDAPGLIDFPTEGHAYRYTNLGGRDRLKVTWWHLPFFTWIVSGSLVLIAVVLRNTSWENKLTLLILAGFLAAAWATQDADLVLHGVAVACYGLAAMLALWLVHGLLRRPARRPAGPPPTAPPAAVIPPPGVFDSVTLGLEKSS